MCIVAYITLFSVIAGNLALTLLNTRIEESNSNILIYTKTSANDNIQYKRTLEISSN